jgi:tetratricopeptide (TPR) repeat protein
MTRVGLALVGAAVALVGCGPAGDEHEQRGDRAYSEARFADAAASYRLALETGPDPDLWAKLGAASLRRADYASAAEAFRALAASDDLRVPEAVQGLDLAAQGAEQAGDPQGLQVVLLALHAVAPDWANGSYALTVMRGVDTPPEERLAFLPTAAAAAPDRRTADSLLGAFAEVLRETGSCEKAIRVYRSVLRRTEDVDLEDQLLNGRAECAYQIGLEQLTDEPWTAEGWFLEAIDSAPEETVGRRALLALGDARAAQGDLIGAALAYQSAVRAESPADSITIVAMERLNDIASASGEGGPEVTP